MSELFIRLRQRYQANGGAYAEPILKLSWPYKIADEPSPEELAKEINGYATTDFTDATGAAIKGNAQLAGFGQLKDDGSTASGCWIFCGSWTEQGNKMARRDNSDPYGMKQHQGWAWAWPANRRILYNRASCDPQGKPWDEKKRLVWWNGKVWGGTDVPDFKADSPPEAGMNPFIMNPEGVARFFAVDKMNEGPFPEHYEPFETPIGINPLHPKNKKATSNPAARIFDSVWDSLGVAKDYPYAATSYRLTEHFHFWSKHCKLNAIAQPEQFVEIGEVLAKEKGIVAGDRVRVSSKRGHIEAVAVVTKRIRPLQVNNQVVHQIGIPLHWGFTGAHASRLPDQHPGAVPRRWQHPDPGIQVIPGQRGESLNGQPRHHRPFGHHDRPVLGTQSGGSGQADRHHQVHRLQGLPGRLLGMERAARRCRPQPRHLRQPSGPERRNLDLDALHRA